MIRTLRLHTGKLVLLFAVFWSHTESPAQEAAADSATSLPCREIERERDVVLSFITISAPNLPKHIRLVDRVPTTPLIPVTKNPDILSDPIRLMPVAAFFGITKRADLEPKIIGVTAIYQSDVSADELGIYGLYFKNGETAKRLFEKLTRTQRNSPFILKGRLLLYVWKDDGVRKSDFDALCDHLRKSAFRPEDGT